MAPQQFQLVMKSGPTPGKIFDLDKDEVNIGRDVNNDVVVNDAEVSRRHARITSQKGSLVIEDLGSTNGTYINNIRLSGPRMLQSGETITLGENISLNFKLVQVEPEDTVVSESQPEIGAPSQPPAFFASEEFTQPEALQQPPSYASRIPPSLVEPPAQPKRRSNTWLFIGCLGLIAILCIAVLVAAFYIDQRDIWCEVLPFLPGCID